MCVCVCSSQVYREGKWTKMSTDQLLPGDLVSIGKLESLHYPLNSSLVHASHPVFVEAYNTVSINNL